jgi:hypothetical protein
MDTVTVIEENSVVPDRRRLMTAFLDAVEFVKNLEGYSVQERLEAISFLLDRRHTMEKHPTMKNFRVFPFFKELGLSPKQNGYLLESLTRERIATCAELFVRDTNTLERILDGGAGIEKIPYPLALQALHYAHQHF